MSALLESCYRDDLVADRSTLTISCQAAFAVAVSFGLPVAPSAPRHSNRHLYFARHERQLKIGISSKPRERMRELQSRGTHRLLLVIYGCEFEHERTLHRFLRHESTGREYFSGPTSEALFAALAHSSVAVSDMAPAWAGGAARSRTISLGQKLLEAILESETQVSFSRRTGLSQPEISQLANGKRTPSRLATALALEAAGIPCGAWDELITEAA